MNPITVDIFSDVICPWCFLGKRRLDKALGLASEVQVEVNFRPYFLDPTIPPEGLDRVKYMTDKFGTERLKTIHDPLIKAGAEDGVPFRFDQITRTPNTLDAHRLIYWARDKQIDVAEKLFVAYWRDGRDVSTHDVLIEIADESGLDRKQVKIDLSGDKDAAQLMQEVYEAHQIGITGVPTYILQRKYAVVGAQSAETLATVLRQVAAL